VSTVRRLCAIGGGLLAGLALVGLVVADVGSPGLRLQGYVSEFGATGAPMANIYRLAVLGFAGALALLGISVRPISGLAALAVMVAAGSAGLSAAVRCTPGCPLPPDPSTPNDIVHASSSIVAFTVAACALFLLALRAPDPAIRRVCGWTVLLMVGFGFPDAVGIVAIGRGLITGVLERVTILGATLGLLRLSAVLARRPPVRLPARGESQGASTFPSNRTPHG
jgi:hypothetical protein